MSSKTEVARRSLLDALSESEAEAARLRAALDALGHARRAPARKPRAKSVDNRPLSDRALELIASQGPVAAGRLAPVLHCSPKQAADVVGELVVAGKVREASRNRRNVPLYEVA